jgi:dienelactone hydrolase
VTGLRDSLRARFEIGAHPLSFRAAVPAGPGLDRLTFATAGGAPVRGFFLRPRGAGPWPAVLVIHAHGNAYGIGADELMQGRPALAGPLGPALAASGFAALCLDMPCFGARAGVGESAAAKAALWQGRTLAGQMLGESASALDWLAARADVRADRIGLFGLSMGATLGYWLAAVDDRVAALAQECCLADFAALIATGAHDLHGPYLTVPGLLALASNGTIAGLVAPRPQFVGWGEDDPLTPPVALETALAELRAAYARVGGDLVIHREPGIGHQETPAMRRAMLDFLVEHLRL